MATIPKEEEMVIFDPKIESRIVLLPAMDGNIKNRLLETADIFDMVMRNTRKATYRLFMNRW